MRCAFCPAPAECSREPVHLRPAACWTHRRLAADVAADVCALTGGRVVTWGGAWHRWVWSLRDAVVARDAAEQRGEPPDASGWVLFG